MGSLYHCSRYRLIIYSLTVFVSFSLFRNRNCYKYKRCTRSGKVDFRSEKSASGATKLLVSLGYIRMY